MTIDFGVSYVKPRDKDEADAATHLTAYFKTVEKALAHAREHAYQLGCPHMKFRPVNVGNRLYVGQEEIKSGWVAIFIDRREID